MSASEPRSTSPAWRGRMSTLTSAVQSDADEDLAGAIDGDVPGPGGCRGALIADQQRRIAGEQEAVGDEVAGAGGGVDAEPEPDDHAQHEGHARFGIERQNQERPERAHDGADRAIESLRHHGARRRLRQEIDRQEGPLRVLEGEPVGDRQGDEPGEGGAQREDEIPPAEIDGKGCRSGREIASLLLMGPSGRRPSDRP